MILDGDLAAGHKLPSSRALASQAASAVSRSYRPTNSLTRKDSSKAAQGPAPLSPSQSPKRRRRATKRSAPTSQPGGSAFGSGQSRRAGRNIGWKSTLVSAVPFPTSSPTTSGAALLARYLSTDDVMLSRYGSPLGFLPLRQALAGYLVRQRGVVCTPQQVVIVSGAQQASGHPGPPAASRRETRLWSKRRATTTLTGFSRRMVPSCIPLHVDEQGLPVAELPASDASESRLCHALAPVPARRQPVARATPETAGVGQASRARWSSKMIMTANCAMTAVRSAPCKGWMKAAMLSTWAPSPKCSFPPCAWATSSCRRRC